MDIRRYLSKNGTDPFGAWLSSLRDSRAKAAVLVRIARLSMGNLGGGDKRRQGRDIQIARERLDDYHNRTPP